MVGICRPVHIKTISTGNVKNVIPSSRANNQCLQHRDDVEDEELEVAQLMEGMPTALAGFKDHPLFVFLHHRINPPLINP